MPSRLYSVIFNNTLGRLVVVSEKTVAQGKAGSQGGHDNSHSTADSQAWGMVGYCYGKWLTLTAAVLVSLGTAQWAHADVQTQVIADATAAKNEQATILTTASGITQVNIQTPSAAGVSKNGTVAKLAMRQPFVLFKGLTFQKLCLPGAFRPGDHHNKMLRPGLCVVHASPQYL